MNHIQRRALARPSRRRIAVDERKRKGVRQLAPQRCVLWVPARAGYVLTFGRENFQVVEFAESARHYEEDEAASVALAFREVTGLRVAVRAVHNARASAA